MTAVKGKKTKDEPQTVEAAIDKIVNQQGPGCCGPVPNRIALVRQISQGAVMAHVGLAAMYRGLAAEVTNPKDKKAMLDAAEAQKKLAEESQKVVIPEGVTDKAISSAMSALMTPPKKG